ncbi:MAG: fluoride efflux transporter CrcB [Gammaproteobacteria bacterium]|nr:fluoride efflux transporter CrcB [Gammaproteobacteria bacterium]
MNGIQPLLWIGLAGAAGAVLRYLISQGVMNVFGRGFPFGTLVVNVLGSFMVGVLFVVFWERAEAGELLRLVLIVGLLGSLTTFSAFSLETWILVQHGAFLKAGANILANVAICLAATWLGIIATRTVL